MRKRLLFLLLLFLTVSTIYPVYAGGGYINVTGSGTGVVKSQSIYVQAKIPALVEDHDSIGEKIEFFIWNRSPLGGPETTLITENPDGATCITTNPIVDSNHLVQGVCSATQDGVYAVGVKVSINGQEVAQMGRYKAVFTNFSPPTSTPTPTLTPTPLPTNTPTPTPPTPAPKSFFSHIPVFPSFFQWLASLFHHKANLKAK